MWKVNGGRWQKLTLPLTRWAKKNKQWSTKHTHKTKDRVTQNPLKTGVNSGGPEGSTVAALLVALVSLMMEIYNFIIFLTFWSYWRHFQQYISYIMATSFNWWKKLEYPERTTDHGRVTGNLYHLWLRVECILFCNLQSRARTHAVLVMGLYELLGNPTI
jgi:hypothetical protein